MKEINILNLEYDESVKKISSERDVNHMPWLPGLMNEEKFNVLIRDKDSITTVSNDSYILLVYYYAPWCSEDVFNKTNGLYQRFDNVVRDLLKKDNVYLLIENVQEGETTEFFFDAYPYFQSTDIPMDKIIYNTSSLTLFDDHDRFCKTNNIESKMKVYGSSVWEDMGYYYDEHQYNIVPTEYKDREKKYLNLNRRLRSHRPAFVSLLSEMGLLEHGKVSLFTSDDGESTPESYVHCKLYYTHLRDRIEHGFNKIKDKLPMTLDKTDGSINYAIDPDATALYTSTYFSLVSSTFFYHRYDTVQMNEKIFKPIVYKQPFVMIATPGFLKYLKLYGFKTFDRWIDESYDSIRDDTERAEAILKEVKRLSELSNEEWDVMIEEMQDVLNYNQNRIFNIDMSFEYNKTYDFFNLFK